MGSTTFGKGGTKAEKIKRANEAKAAERLAKVLKKGQELTGIEGLRYEIAEVKRHLASAEYDKKVGQYANFIEVRINNFKAELNDKEILLREMIMKEKSNLFICWDCHREFNTKKDIDEHECTGKENE